MGDGFVETFQKRGYRELLFVGLRVEREKYRPEEGDEERKEFQIFDGYFGDVKGRYLRDIS